MRWHPVLGWVLWLLFVVALIPGVARRVQSFFASGPGASLDARLPIVLACSLAAALLLLPDRTNFVGDFLLRQGSSEMLVEPGRLAPQMLPLDHALHYELPTWLHARFSIPPNASGRLLGALSGVLLAFAASSLARQLAPRAATWRWAFAILLTWGGWAMLLTGYMKAFVEMVWIVPLAATLALRVPKSPRAFLWLSAVVTLGLLLHRSAIGLVPVWAYLAWQLWTKRGSASGAALVGAAPVLLTVAWLTVRVAGAFGRVDSGHFSWAAILDPLRFLDVANGLWALCPLLLCLVPALLDSSWWRSGSGRTLALLALPYIGLALVLAPTQGLYRDVDVLAMSGVSLALVLAGALAAWASEKRLAAWLAVPIAVGAVTLTIPKLFVQSQLEVNLARIEAWVEGPPARSDRDRALTLEFLGARLLHAQRYPEGTVYLGRAAQLAPSPRMLLEWAVAAESIQDWDAVHEALTAILERADEPTYGQLRLVATLGLAKVAGAKGERARLDELAAEAHRLSPESSLVSQMLQDAYGRLMRAEMEARGRAASEGSAAPDTARSPAGPVGP